ncbi:MAG: efflux RND transporter periplasmic adaptor subunit [Acidithiobacillus sp.]
MRLSRQKIAIGVIAVLIIAGGITWWQSRPNAPAEQITIYGNVDIRQIQSAFDDTGRIQKLSVEEGDQVHKDQVLAELNPERFQDAVDRARAQVNAQQQILARLLAGSRPEEIVAARAATAAAQATLANDEATAHRQQALAAEQYVSKQNADNAAAALKNARANLERAQQNLILAIKGPRKEDIALARSQLKADEAALKLAQRQLTDTRLLAPADAVIQDRILEAGDMASPQQPVFTLALDNPVWIRAYLPEKMLGKIRMGMRATIHTDSFPGKNYSGWIGFISPSAEFTPKTVQTTELRTELVYRVRIYACNPQHQLRLGMPVTVLIPLHDNKPKEHSRDFCGH